MTDANSDLDPEELDYYSSLHKNKGKEGDREAAKELIAATNNHRYTLLKYSKNYIAGVHGHRRLGRGRRAPGDYL